MRVLSLSVLLLLAPLAGAEAAEKSPADKALLERLPEGTRRVALWPGGAPDANPDVAAEKVSGSGDDIIRVHNVSRPTMFISLPNDAEQPVPVVIVCPGGGYNILAAEHEGTEVCEWLLEQGIAAVLLKYRVPRPQGELEKHHHALQDVQRAVSLVRTNSREWGLDPKRVGVLGFSAGGHLAATLSNRHAERTYEPVDAADEQSCRPDVAVLIYPAYLTEPADSDQLDPLQQLDKATAERTCPTFIAIARPDRFTRGAVQYFAALSNKDVPSELHVYADGRHGTGLRVEPLSHWGRDAADWLKRRGFGAKEE